MKETILKTNNLSKTYKKQTIVNKLNINIYSGDIYGFIGKNGAGKTTTIRMITGLAKKTSGEIELFGENEEKELNKKRSLVGSLVETPTFYGELSAEENLEISRLVRNIPGKDCIKEVLETVGLKDVGNKKVKNFSLGMKQRLGIANALLGNPKLLILDEPINGLDPISIVEIRELLKRINKEKGVTILISSHILSELSEIATRYGIINNGELVEELSSKELKEKCKQYIELKVNDSKKATVVLESKLNIKSYEVLPNNIIKVYEKLDSLGDINTTLALNGIVLELSSLKGQNLEDYFLNVIGGNKND